MSMLGTHNMIINIWSRFVVVLLERCQIDEEIAVMPVPFNYSDRS